MYNDGRAGAQAHGAERPPARRRRRPLQRLVRQRQRSSGCATTHRPSASAAARFLHQTDFVNARLLGATHAADVATDESSALKTGYDIVAAPLAGSLADAGIDPGQLPPVVPGGTTLGPIGAGFAARHRPAAPIAGSSPA